LHRLLLAGLPAHCDIIMKSPTAGLAA
jgi:hypothetical protein